MIPRGTIIAFAFAALAVGACDTFSKQSGPDEFAVVTRAPLSMPPDFGLRPPRRGAHRPNEISPREEARDKLHSNLGGGDLLRLKRSGKRTADRKSGLTKGETALLGRANAKDVDPSIRHLVERESGRVKEDKSLVDTLVFWRDSSKSGIKTTVVNPAAEAKRLRDNAALGKPPTAGRTPISVQK